MVNQQCVGAARHVGGGYLIPIDPRRDGSTVGSHRAVQRGRSHEYVGGNTLCEHSGGNSQ